MRLEWSPTNQGDVANRSALHARLRSPTARDKRGVDLISDVLLLGRLWYGGPNAVANAIGYAEHFSRSLDAVIRVYDESGTVIETHERISDAAGWAGSTTSNA